MAETRITHYQIVRRIGAGGMGEVLLAQDTVLDRSVAIKLMSEELAKDPAQRKRFRAEAKAASGLSHPNICVIHEVGETEDGRPFLAMEYMEGRTLNELMQQRRLKMREILSIGFQVAEALEAAHARGIVHRDIKPANIMVNAKGQAKVLDFGLAKRFEQEELSSTNSTAALTRPGFLVGTPDYMSPEQVLGRPVDPKSDIFSLGVILYELTAGQRPFLGKTVGEILNHVVNQQPEPLGLENPIFSPALDGIIFKCLEKEPEKRYASARELADDLNRVRAESERAAAQAGPITPVGTPASVVAGKGTPDVVPYNQPAGKDGRAHSMTGSGRLLTRAALIGVTIVVVGLAVWGLSHRGKSGETAASGSRDSGTTAAVEKSVAVLPFDNFSADKDTDYLSDGLTEEITAALARVPGLRVAARNSAFTFKNRKEDLRKVGAMLGVATILEGSLRKTGNRIRVTAQLINVMDGLHLWADTYDRTMDDILAVQEDVARKIAERFELKPASEVSGGAKQPAAPNQEAYALYLKGLHSWNKRTKDDLEQAAQLFKDAVDKDPSYAAAYAGLASTYVLLPDYASRPASEYVPLAQAAAERALVLDPMSADAHAVLGLVRQYARELKKSEEEYRRAIQLNPNHATAHHWYGILLRGWNRADEAAVELQKAEALDPLSPIIKFNAAAGLAYNRQYQAALEKCERDMRAFPDFALFHSGRGYLLLLLGHYPEALSEVLAARAKFTNSPYLLGQLGFTYARNGDTANARKVLAELEDWKKRGSAVCMDLALVHVGLKESDQALDELEAADRNGDALNDLLVDPMLDEIRATPRFQALLKKMGLKE